MQTDITTTEKDFRPLIVSDQDMETIHPLDVPAVFLPYQRRWVEDPADVKVIEKSRRTGITWAEAADDVLVAATEGRAGLDVMYIGYELEMTREYITTCAFWAKHFTKAVEGMDQYFLVETDKIGNSREIQAFRIRFTSGHKIVALTSSPRNLRGRQGRVILDEAAFHDDLPGVLKAALALLIWGGQVFIISTHNGEDHPFNQLVEDIRAKKVPYSLHRVTFKDAIAEGLYKRICLVSGREWTPEGEAAWEAEFRAKYADDAAEELDCIPSKGGGTYLVRTVIEACMRSEIPVLLWTPPSQGFVDWSDEQRFREMRDWCEGELSWLCQFPDRASWFGEDFGRDVDLTVIWPLQEYPGLTYHTPLTLELRDCPFTSQEQVLFYLCDRLPRLGGGALDKGGNGAFLAERARQRYGVDRIDQISFHEAWNLENWPPLKAALEDRVISLPKSDDVLDDLRAVKKVKGVPKVPRDSRTKSAADGGKRHGDSAIACALAYYAARKFEPQGPMSVESVVPRQSTSMLKGFMS